MGEFNGFSEAVLLYSKNYRVVEWLGKKYKEERDQLFNELEERLVEKPWASAEGWEFYQTGGWLGAERKTKTKPATTIQIEINVIERGITENEKRDAFFEADLRVGREEKDKGPIKQAFSRLAKTEIKKLPTDAFKHTQSNRTVLSYRVNYQNESTFTTCLETFEFLWAMSKKLDTAVQETNKK